VTREIGRPLKEDSEEVADRNEAKQDA